MSTPTYDSDLVVPTRFRGPPRSGNGGYTAGLLAERVPHGGGCPAIEVTLRQPPPLDVPMTVQHLPAEDPTNLTEASATRLLMGGATIAEAVCADLDLEAVDAVSAGEAAAAMADFPGHRSHPFPTCFSCGPDRAEGDGLRIFPGPTGDNAMASHWVPHESVAESSDLLDGGVRRVGLATAWAALDCIGGWAGGVGERRMVLGKITAQVDALPVVGEPHVVVGAARGQQGRKTFTVSTLYDSDGRIVGRAQHTWIAVDPETFS